MQALGAYGFRGFYERKVHFLQSVPYALKNLRWLCFITSGCPSPSRRSWTLSKGMLASEKLQALATDATTSSCVFSSFRSTRACRGRKRQRRRLCVRWPQSPNPGREERFKTLTGKDAPVIDYLNQQETVHQFLAGVLSLVDSSIANYQQRGFKNLMSRSAVRAASIAPYSSPSNCQALRARTASKLSCAIWS